MNKLHGIAATLRAGRARSLRGRVVLLVGASGAGKTEAAHVIASELGRALLQVDLAKTVSKYIGETEKNLERIFLRAEQAGAVLFFDEADALFGKRGEVKDAHDRYANFEIGFLMQRLDVHKGPVIVAARRRANLDPAFLRRLRFVVTLPSRT